MTKRKLHRLLLVIEDSDEDFIAIRRGLQKAGFEGRIERCNTGDQALVYLRATRQRHIADDLPDLIFLDLNLPGTDGQAVLAALKNDTAFKSIPVIAVSGQDDMHNVDICYRLGINSFVPKPVTPSALTRIIHDVESYWLKDNALPDHRGS